MSRLHLTLLTSVFSISNVFSSGLEFLAMGDWGGQPDSPYYTTDEKDTAATMGEIASSYDASFVLAIGDNFYDNGVENVDDKRFQETFEDVFTADSLTNIPFYVVAGNHDWNGNVTAQIDYTNKSPNNRWQFSDYYYSKVISIPDTDYTLEIIMIDTVIMCGETVDNLKFCEKNHLKPQSPKCTMTPLGPSDKSKADDEWKWINETLAASTADFVIVSGHYPIWSIAEHGPTTLLVDKLRPLLLQYGVQLYMNGHDHTMEYIQETDNPDLGYVTTGAAHVCDTSTDHENDVPKDSLLYHDCDDGGFVRINIDSDGLTVYYYLSKSTDVTYTTKTFQPRSQAKKKGKF